MWAAIITAAVTLLVAIIVRNHEAHRQRLERRVGLYADWVKSVGEIAGSTSVRNVPTDDKSVTEWREWRDEAWSVHSHLYEQLLFIGKVETVLAAQRVVTALREADRIKLQMIADKKTDHSFLGVPDYYNNYPHTALIFTLLGEFADEVRNEMRHKQIAEDELRKARTLSEAKSVGQLSRHTRAIPSSEK